MEQGDRVIVVYVVAGAGLPSFEQVVDEALREAKVETTYAPFKVEAFREVQVKHVWTRTQFAALQDAAMMRAV